MRKCPANFGHAVGDAADDFRIIVEQPEHQRIIRRRADIQAHDAPAQIREAFGGRSPHDPFAGWLSLVITTHSAKSVLANCCTMSLRGKHRRAI